MQPHEFLSRVVECLDGLGAPYLVTGSVATIAYGEPRMTVDTDIAVQLSERQARALCDAFASEEYYVNPEAAAAAARDRTQFNIIHPSQGLKIDLMIPSGGAFDQSRFGRARRIQIAPEVWVMMASPEDVILKKLEYFKAGGSDKHLRDIAGVLRHLGEEIDQAYIERWATRLGVETEWASALNRVRES